MTAGRPARGRAQEFMTMEVTVEHVLSVAGVCDPPKADSPRLPELASF